MYISWFGRSDNYVGFAITVEVGQIKAVKGWKSAGERRWSPKSSITVSIQNGDLPRVVRVCYGINDVRMCIAVYIRNHYFHNIAASWIRNGRAECTISVIEEHENIRAAGIHDVGEPIM